jgi:hypothetical protein
MQNKMNTLLKLDVSLKESIGKESPALSTYCICFSLRSKGLTLWPPLRLMEVRSRERGGSVKVL